MELQRLLSLTRKAVDEYSQIEEGDRIAVGISGGKDSLTLLYALSNLRRFYPNSYELRAITVDLGLPGFDTEGIRALCEKLEVPYTVVETDIYRIIFNERRESNPCSLCAKMRKGSLNEAIKELGCNKVAYGHHKDDVVETLLLSLIFEGRFHTFSPVTYLDRTGITVIRPLLYVEEADVIGFANKMELPVAGKLCPADGHTKREYAKDLLNQLNRDNPGVKDRIFTAIEGSFIKGWSKNELS
ncbi:MAG: tRNA 2-thiocytidine(32) synthetase TtcA [Lachnospiraceae bacterium]|nr:tRNA 2-thiocytidine(32) synthetase TtcA [Lachnospiraceae bacterium]